MATETAPDTTARFVTRRLLALTAVIFLLNLPTIGAFGTPTAKIGAMLLYLGGAFATASALKLVALVARGGVDAIPR